MPRAESKVKGSAILVGLAIGAATSVLVYALERMGERRFLPEPNPAMLIWADRDPFVWRAAIALYAGVLGVFGGHALARRSAEAAARCLFVALVVALVALLAQGAMAP